MRPKMSWDRELGRTSWDASQDELGQRVGTDQLQGPDCFTGSRQNTNRICDIPKTRFFGIACAVVKLKKDEPPPTVWTQKIGIFYPPKQLFRRESRYCFMTGSPGIVFTIITSRTSVMCLVHLLDTPIERCLEFRMMRTIKLMNSENKRKMLATEVPK